MRLVLIILNNIYLFPTLPLKLNFNSKAFYMSAIVTISFPSFPFSWHMFHIHILPLLFPFSDTCFISSLHPGPRLCLLWIYRPYHFLPCVLPMFYSLLSLFHIHCFTLTGAAPRGLRSSNMQHNFHYLHAVCRQYDNLVAASLHTAFTYNYYLNLRTE